MNLATLNPDDLAAMRLTPFDDRSFSGPVPPEVQDDLREAMLFDARRMPKGSWHQHLHAGVEKMKEHSRQKAIDARAARKQQYPEVAALRAQGLSIEAVARRLGRSKNTIKLILRDGA